MRELVFVANDTEEKRYMVVFNALCFAQGELADRTELQTHRNLVRKLKAIGVIVNPTRTENESAAYLCPNGGTVLATEPEYQILKRFLTAHIKNVMRVLSDELLTAIEWADNLAEKKDAALPKPKVQRE